MTLISAGPKSGGEIQSIYPSLYGELILNLRDKQADLDTNTGSSAVLRISLDHSGLVLMDYIRYLQRCTARRWSFRTDSS